MLRRVQHAGRCGCSKAKRSEERLMLERESQALVRTYVGGGGGARRARRRRVRAPVLQHAPAALLAAALARPAADPTALH